MRVPANPVFQLVLVTAPDIDNGRKIARVVLESKTAACVNILPKIESHYWWNGKLEETNEVLLIIKTTASKIVPLEKLIIDNHPYDTPEFITLPISSGNERYLNWLRDCLLPDGK
jgi:periplasmic divalent cation tolerance protein